MIHRKMDKTVWKSGGSHSWYQRKSGHVMAMFPWLQFHLLADGNIVPACRSSRNPSAGLCKISHELN